MANGFKGVTQPGQSLVSDQLETNLAHFFQWNLANIGGFLNVTINEASGFGGDMSRLRPVSDPRIDGGTAGRMWEAFRKDWVFESGLAATPAPIQVSGVYVNGTFYATVSTTGTYAHSVDYPNGRVVFNTPIPATSKVQCEYSFRLYSVSTADVPWWRELQTRSLRGDDPQFLSSTSGTYAALTENRIQLPHIIVEAVPKMTYGFGKELGNLVVTSYEEVRFNILAETRPDMKFLHDTVTLQKDVTLDMYDRNAVLMADKFPLGPNGSPAASGQNYPDLVNNYFYKKATFSKVSSIPQSTKPPLYTSIVAATMEVNLP